MSPKEQSEELINKFSSLNQWVGGEGNISLGTKMGKQCAIICVEQIIQVLNKQDDPGNGIIIYWQEVLKQIKLITN